MHRLVRHGRFGRLRANHGEAQARLGRFTEGCFLCNHSHGKCRGWLPDVVVVGDERGDSFATSQRSTVALVAAGGCRIVVGADR